MENEKEKNILQIGKTYKLIIFSCGQTLTYTARVVSLDNNFISFQDKFKNVLTYNLNSVVSLSEVLN